MSIIEKSKILDVIEASYLDNYRLKIKFEDGFVKDIDFKPFIGKGISKQLSDQNYFKKFKIDGGTIAWPNGYDFCPSFLREYKT